MREEQPAPALSHPDGELLRYGRPHRVLAGSLHYFRVHPEQWADRLARLAALGLNTVDTYVPWNFHERHRGRAGFDGWRDVERFLRLAQEAGLDAIVRPGPYICAEWDNGGLPAWLTGTPGMRPRSSHGPFLDAVAGWFDRLIPRLAALQAAQGGPVVAVQVENEYGSYGDDHVYLRRLRDALVERGITELLFTADGPTELMLDGGTLPEELAAATFGSQAAEAAALLRKRRRGEPFFCAEFWNGWFDHWGEPHHVRSPRSAAGTLGDILDAGGSVSLYMAHGGTNFGLWAGSNHDGESVQPTVTSYDSDAPIAEHGGLTPKFHALRDQLNALTGRPEQPAPADPVLLAPRVVPVVRGAGLLGGLEAVSRQADSPHPLTFEELGQSSGLVLHRAQPKLPEGAIDLTVSGLHDRAQVFVDGVPAGILDRETGTLTLQGTGRRVRLELLVENQGRINYGPLLGQGKGILGHVRVGRRMVHGWTTHPLPLDEWSGEEVARAAAAGDPRGTAGFATARFAVDERADTFLALPGFAKGFVWINGFLLGRYWEIGPQVTLYLPAPLLVPGENTVTLLELERLGEHIELRDAPELGEPEEYIETFTS
ncbi:glycoside hydrolase family 35 protein [Streptomyces sp. NPDC088337]|uniref:glycoside hydrolase family 35 protein n=1 Tax=unclassified Streptomyces TaxID=2593676 RepID=UPI002DD83C10|nr:glycoside hydrolase family 35 protein [Streptomyces sp. NBC_01788]WSB31380.1 beta-galactosidase [Streptomyces sp. NBC_01788]